MRRYYWAISQRVSDGRFLLFSSGAGPEGHIGTGCICQQAFRVMADFYGTEDEAVALKNELIMEYVVQEFADVGAALSESR